MVDFGFDTNLMRFVAAQLHFSCVPTANAEPQRKPPGELKSPNPTTPPPQAHSNARASLLQPPAHYPWGSIRTKTPHIRGPNHEIAQC